MKHLLIFIFPVISVSNFATAFDDTSKYCNAYVTNENLVKTQIHDEFIPKSHLHNGTEQTKAELVKKNYRLVDQVSEAFVIVDFQIKCGPLAKPMKCALSQETSGKLIFTDLVSNETQIYTSNHESDFTKVISDLLLLLPNCDAL